MSRPSFQLIVASSYRWSQFQQHLHNPWYACICTSNHIVRTIHATYYRSTATAVHCMYFILETPSISLRMIPLCYRMTACDHHLICWLTYVQLQSRTVPTIYMSFQLTTTTSLLPHHIHCPTLITCNNPNPQQLPYQTPSIEFSWRPSHQR